MSEFEDVERLVRLKRHEQPPEEFLEEFMRSFHQRQRVELMNQSARGLIWERLTGLFESFFVPKYALAGCAAMMLVGVGGYVVMPKSTPSSPLVQEASTDPRGAVSYDEFKMARAQMSQDPLYLGSHYKGGFGDAQESQPASKRPALPPATSIQGTALPASFSQTSDFSLKLDLE